MTLHVTHHAISRAIERCGFETAAEARQALTSPTIALAAEIGAPFVKLGTGQRVCLVGSSVVTVLPKDEHRSCLTMERDWMHGRHR